MARWAPADLPVQQDRRCTVPFARSAEMSLMSAAHSGKFSKTGFKKCGFATVGPEPSAGK